MYFEDENRAEAIRQLYAEILQREADSGGLEFYYNSKQPLSQIRNILESSTERIRLLKKQAGEGCEYEFIEPWIAAGSAILINDIPKIKKEGFTALLDMCSTDPIYKPEDFELCLRLQMPSNVVMSVSDVKKAVVFLKEVYETGRKLLIIDDDGTTKGPAIIALWYIGTGMDSEVAGTFVSSRKSNANLNGAILGPWHINAAKGILGPK